MFTLTFREDICGSIQLHSVTSDETFDILWKDMQEILKEAYKISLKGLLATKKEKRDPCYFRLETTKEGNAYDIDVCVILQQ